MARLTDTKIRNVKPGKKQKKLFDGLGLLLLVTPRGGKYWRFRYRFAGKEKLLSLGVYPEVSLAEAREKTLEMRRLLRRGLNPSDARKAVRAANTQDSESFEVIAREWWSANEPVWASTHSGRILRRLERDIFPWIGNKRCDEITAPELLAVIRRIEARGANETAHRALRNVGQVLRYAISTGRATRDVSGDLNGALAPVKAKRLAAITEPRKVGTLLRAIEGYQGTFETRSALKLAAYLFVRPGELRKAEWKEFDLEASLWSIPASKMKARREHIVPLSKQALSILIELHALTGRGRFVFPSIRTRTRPMSENTLTAALRGMGYDSSQMTAHGFRTIASTLLHEQGWNSDVIERQLAHVERNAVKGAYNRAQYLEERIRMMQSWADYLDGLKAGGQITNIHRSRRAGTAG